MSYKIGGLSTNIISCHIKYEGSRLIKQEGSRLIQNRRDIDYKRELLYSLS
jgi:hypothetical protein